MALSGNERLKAQKNVDDILSGDFDERTVDGLFMGLREHAGSNDIFLEIGHFIAHANIRKKGITTESLTTFYLSMKFHSEYGPLNKMLDIYQPFPAYIKNLLICQLKNCDPNFLRKTFGATTSQLTSTLTKILVEDRLNNTVSLRNGKINAANLAVIERMLSYVSVQPAYTQEKILSEMISVIQENGLKMDAEQFSKVSDKVIMCVLVLIHGKKYDLPDKSAATTLISSEAVRIPLINRYIDESGKEVIINHSFGKLRIQGEVVISVSNKDMTFIFDIVDTNLSVENWCDASMFAVIIEETGDTKHGFRTVTFAEALTITDEFKLIAIDD